MKGYLLLLLLFAAIGIRSSEGRSGTSDEETAWFTRIRSSEGRSGTSDEETAWFTRIRSSEGRSGTSDEETARFTRIRSNEGRNTVSGTIDEDTKWLHSNLSVLHAITASISYHVQYPTGWASTPILKFYYNGQSSTDLRDKCIKDRHGQLYNKDLAIPLDGNYRGKFTCEQIDCSTCFLVVKCHCKTWSCSGSTKIQDFEPKSYSFSVGYDCNEAKTSLKGMYYSVTVDNESNKTSCVDFKPVEHCDLGYWYAAIPNQMGDTELYDAITTLNEFLALVGIGQVSLRLIDAPKRPCLQKLKTFLCEIFTPKCSPEDNTIHLPCREKCKYLLNDCAGVDIWNVSCDYLPLCLNSRLHSLTTITKPKRPRLR